MRRSGPSCGRCHGCVAPPARPWRRRPLWSSWSPRPTCLVRVRVHSPPPPSFRTPSPPSPLTYLSGRGKQEEWMVVCVCVLQYGSVDSIVVVHKQVVAFLILFLCSQLLPMPIFPQLHCHRCPTPTPGGKPHLSAPCPPLAPLGCVGRPRRPPRQLPRSQGICGQFLANRR